MTNPASTAPTSLDFAAAERWPVAAAAHVLGAGLLIAVLVALPTAPTDLDRHQLPKETVVHLATWLAVLLARPLWPRGVRPAMLWSLAALVAVAVVSGVLAHDGWLAFRAGALLFTGAAALVTARHLAARGSAPVLLAWCGVAGVAGAGSALLQAYGVTNPLFAVTRVPGGTFGNRNFMAHAAALTLPILFYVAITARARLAMLASLGCAVLVAGIVLSRSRAAWLGAGTGVVVFAAVGLAARRRHSWPDAGRRVAGLAGVIAVSAVATLVIPNRLVWRSTSPYFDTLAGLAAHDEGSGHGRILQYRNTVRLIERHPIVGVGPGNWPVRYGEVAPLDDPSWVWGDVIPLNPWPSSDWMALASEYGLLGAAAVLLLAVGLTWRAVAAARDRGPRAVAGAALLALIVTLGVVGSFDAVLLLPTGVLLVALATGALLELGDTVDPVDRPRPRPSARASAVLALALGVITLRSALQTSAYIVAGNGRSVRRLVWAARIDPGSYPIRIALAQRLPCDEARIHIVAAVAMVPRWPASQLAARRCGVRTGR